MTNQIAKPPYNAKRRIQYLFAFSIFLIGAATAAWYLIAGKIDDVAKAVIAQQALSGVEIACPNRDVRGYPFRFGIFCDSLAVNGLNQGIIIRAGALRSAAQFYDPKLLIAELDGPMQIDLPSGEIAKLNWSALRASTRFNEPLPEHLSIVGNDVSIALPEGKIDATQAEGHMRVVDQDLDLAGRAMDFKMDIGLEPLAGLPLLSADFNARINNGAVRYAERSLTTRNSEGTLNRFAIMLNDDRGILLSGPFSVDADGLVDAQVTLRIIDVDAVFDVLETVMPNIAPMLSAFAEGQPKTGEKNDELELKISILKSQISFGFIPLGKLLPL